MKRIAKNKYTDEKVRFEVFDDYRGYVPCYFVYAKGKKSMGYPMSQENFYNKYVEIIETKEQFHKKRRKQLQRIIDMLSQSGLWNDILERTKKFITITDNDYDNILELNQNRNDVFDELIKNNIKYGDENRDEFIQKFYKNLFGDYINKYPFLFETKHYSLFLEQYECGIPKIKTMNFGSKYINDLERQKIKNAMYSKTPYGTFAYTNYDVSFSYKPKSDNDNIERAWYSEEYKGCGNGHYYLALDNEHALYCEDD